MDTCLTDHVHFTCKSTNFTLNNCCFLPEFPTKNTRNSCCFTRILRWCHTGWICPSFVSDPPTNMMENTVLCMLPYHGIQWRKNTIFYCWICTTGVVRQRRTQFTFVRPGIPNSSWYVHYSSLCNCCLLFLLLREEDLLPGDWIYLSPRYPVLLLGSIQTWCC